MKKQITKSTDWLTRGYSEEEIAKMKEEAIKEAEAELQKKQIDEMVNIINNADPYYECKGARCRDCDFFFSRRTCYAAKALYNAGYRKQSEVAMEIFEEIDENVLGGHFLKSYEWHEEEYGKLKKKFNIEE